KKPANRCESAAEMAAELGRFLNHEPVRSRCIGPFTRTWRWCRRRPAWAVLCLLLTTLPILAGAGLFLHKRQLSALNSQFVANTKAARRAEVVAERSAQHAAGVLYAADMRVADRALRNQDTRTLAEFLDRHIPANGAQADRRGFEWHYLRRNVNTVHRTLLNLNAAQYFVCFSPDRQWIVAAGKDAIVRLLDAETGDLFREIDTKQIEVNGLAFSGDGEELATTGDDGSICLWDVATGRQRLKIAQGNPVQAFQVVFVPGTTLLVCCGADPVLRVFDTETGAKCAEFVGHGRTVQSI